MSRRVSMNARVAGETSSAYTWSPSISSTSGHSSRGSWRIWKASVCSASTSRPRSSSSLRSENGGWCGAATRHDPNITRSGLSFG